MSDSAGIDSNPRGAYCKTLQLSSGISFVHPNPSAAETCSDMYVQAHAKIIGLTDKMCAMLLLEGQ